MSPISDPVIPVGSIVLVTGVNGLIGSHVADQFLEHGYKVRGTVRDAKKNSWIRDLFQKKYGQDKFELVTVNDLAEEGAFDEVAKGVSGIAHVASLLSFDPNPHNVIPQTIAGALNAVKAAAKEPSVKRVVLTSSSSAVLLPKANNELAVDENTWDEDAVREAWRDPPYEPQRGYIVYAASKTQSEQEAWKWYRENKPHFVFNTVLPNCTLGRSLDPVNQGHPSTSGAIAKLFNGELGFLKEFPPQYFVDVQDVGRLHVAAVIHPGVKEERIFGFAEPYNVNTFLAALRKNYPNRKFLDDLPDLGHDLTKVLPAARAEQILKDLGRPGWTSLEESIKNNTEDLA